MSKIPMSRRVFLVIATSAVLTVAGEFQGLRSVSASDPAQDKEYVAVFRRGSSEQPFAIIEKPRGVPIGNGSNVTIDAFALRVATIDAAHAKVFRQQLPKLEAEESQKLPPGFTVYADKHDVEVSYAAASRKYKLTFIDPADVSGMGGGGETGGGAGGGGGNSM